jgi:uncharacterized protein YjbJ (UPF0337 family)
MQIVGRFFAVKNFSDTFVMPSINVRHQVYIFFPLHFMEHREDDDTYDWSATKTKWEGRWQQFTGKAQQLWGDMTNDTRDIAEGKFEEFMGRVKEKTGKTGEALEKEINEEEREFATR